MAAFTTTHPTRLFPTTGTISALQRAALSLRAWNDARVTRKALSRLTVRELDDIGLKRSDIDRIVAGTYR